MKWQYAQLSRWLTVEDGEEQWHLTFKGPDGKPQDLELTDGGAAVTLNALGQEEWEVVGITQRNAFYQAAELPGNPYTEDPLEITYLLKRPAQDS